MHVPPGTEQPQGCSSLVLLSCSPPENCPVTMVQLSPINTSMYRTLFILVIVTSLVENQNFLIVDHKLKFHHLNEFQELIDGILHLSFL